MDPCCCCAELTGKECQPQCMTKCGNHRDLYIYVCFCLSLSIMSVAAFLEQSSSFSKSNMFVQAIQKLLLFFPTNVDGCDHSSSTRNLAQNCFREIQIFEFFGPWLNEVSLVKYPTPCCWLIENAQWRVHAVLVYRSDPHDWFLRKSFFKASRTFCRRQNCSTTITATKSSNSSNTMQQRLRRCADTRSSY